jgi:hypothetical protein
MSPTSEWVVHNFTAALQRARKDFEYSLLHDASIIDEGMDAARTYVQTHVGNASKNVFSVSPFYENFLVHIRDRHPWGLTSKKKQDLCDQVIEPLSIHTICMNTGVLYTLRVLQGLLGDRLQIRSSYLSPVEYLSPLQDSETSEFERAGDFFFSEAATPGRFVDVSRHQSLQFICLVHTARQAMLTRSLLAFHSATPFAVNFTSTVSHAQIHFPAKRIQRLDHPDSWQSVLTSLGKDALFSWEPWTWLIKQTWNDLHTSLESDFPIALFANRESASDQARNSSMLAFISLFIATWRDIFNNQKQLTEESICLIAQDGWREAFGRASLLVRGTEGRDEIILMALRIRLQDLITTLWTPCARVPLLVERLGTERKQLLAWISTCGDAEKLENAISVAEQLLKNEQISHGGKFQQLLRYIPRE